MLKLTKFSGSIVARKRYKGWEVGSKLPLGPALSGWSSGSKFLTSSENQLESNQAYLSKGITN